MMQLSSQTHDVIQAARDVAPPLTVSHGATSLSFMRFRWSGGPQELHVSAGEDNAHLLIYQLQDHPAHHFWEGNCYTPARTAPRDCLNIVDLSPGAAAVLTDPVDSLFIHMPHLFLDELVTEMQGRSPCQLSLEDPWTTRDPFLQLLAPLVVGALEGTETVEQLFFQELGMSLAFHLADHYGSLRPTSRNGQLAAWQENRAKEMMAASLSGETSIADIAGECGLSPSYFARAFKSTTGLTPSAWLQERRLERARYLLAFSTHPISEIALLCGFADNSHFTRSFRRSTGRGPKDWRRTFRC
jgi:AraC family transcriptional regulator